MDGAGVMTVRVDDCSIRFEIRGVDASGSVGRDFVSVTHDGMMVDGGGGCDDRGTVVVVVVVCDGLVGVDCAGVATAEVDD
jgi:hypothetical protein